MRELNEFHLLGPEVMTLNRGDLPVLVARRPFRKFCLASGLVRLI